jgi:hypothetical protein
MQVMRVDTRRAPPLEPPQLVRVPGIPQPPGFTSDGREVVTILQGVVPSYPMPAWVWTEAALESAGRLFRHIRDAVEGQDLPGPWRSPVHQPEAVICHNHFAPYNLIFDSAGVIGVIDWDFASPGPGCGRSPTLLTAWCRSRLDWADGCKPDERLTDLLHSYGADTSPTEVIGVLGERLRDLAGFTDEAALRSAKSKLAHHADLYQHDAARLGAR